MRDGWIDAEKHWRGTTDARTPAERIKCQVGGWTGIRARPTGLPRCEFCVAPDRHREYRRENGTQCQHDRGRKTGEAIRSSVLMHMIAGRVGTAGSGSLETP